MSQVGSKLGSDGNSLSLSGRVSGTSVTGSSLEEPTRGGLPCSGVSVLAPVCGAESKSSSKSYRPRPTGGHCEDCTVGECCLSLWGNLVSGEQGFSRLK